MKRAENDQFSIYGNVSAIFSRASRLKSIFLQIYFYTFIDFSFNWWNHSQSSEISLGFLLGCWIKNEWKDFLCISMEIFILLGTWNEQGMSGRKYSSLHSFLLDKTECNRSFLYIWSICIVTIDLEMEMCTKNSLHDVQNFDRSSGNSKLQSRENQMTISHWYRLSYWVSFSFIKSILGKCNCKSCLRMKITENLY